MSTALLSSLYGSYTGYASERIRCSGGRSPAHTKTAHSNTSTVLLLKINAVWKQESDKKNRRPSSPPHCGYNWRTYSSSSPRHLFCQPLPSHPTHCGCRTFTPNTAQLCIPQHPMRRNDPRHTLNQLVHSLTIKLITYKKGTNISVKYQYKPILGLLNAICQRTKDYSYK